MTRLKAYSELTGDVVDFGESAAPPEQLALLGETLATNRPGLIVFVEGSLLQQWRDADG